jgi:pyridoxal phosphate enzyme (YggS family)
LNPIAENLNVIHARIAGAAERAGRKPEEIRLVAVTKTQSTALVREAVQAGAREIGENYVQEAEAKLAELGAVPVKRHLIGHLQRNKAGKAAVLFDVVQSVDSLELARALGRRAEALGRTLEVLLEVNISGEQSKFGVPPEQALDLAGQVLAVSGLEFNGLMGIGPLSGDERETRRSFGLLAELWEKLPAANRQVLSMGMTGDFEWAIAEGSTMVRIGTALFGARRSGR